MFLIKKKCKSIPLPPTHHAQWWGGWEGHFAKMPFFDRSPRPIVNSGGGSVCKNAIFFTDAGSIISRIVEVSSPLLVLASLLRSLCKVILLKSTDTSYWLRHGLLYVVIFSLRMLVVKLYIGYHFYCPKPLQCYPLSFKADLKPISTSLSSSPTRVYDILFRFSSFSTLINVPKMCQN